MKSKTNALDKPEGDGSSPETCASDDPASPPPACEPQMEMVAEYLSGQKSKGWGMRKQMRATDEPEPDPS
jgi:hypothetical protein